jgi:hypothetical protein
MPRKRKPATPEPQAPPPSWNTTAAFSEQMRAAAEQARALRERDEFKQSDSTKLREDLKQSPDKLREELGPPDIFRELAASLRQQLLESGPVAVLAEAGHSSEQQRKPSKRGEYKTGPRVLIRRASQALWPDGGLPDTDADFCRAIGKQLGKDCPSRQTMRREFKKLAKPNWPNSKFAKNKK